MSPVTPYRLGISEVPLGGTPVTVAYGPLTGGIIGNPSTAEGQGIDTVEPLFIDIVGEAALNETITTVPIQPGGTYKFTQDQTTNVSVNAASSGHRFSGFVYQPQTPFPPAPQPGTFPPSGPTTLTQNIPAYLYEEYADDDDLQAFVGSYNQLVQGFVTWFANVGLPVYTGEQIIGTLLDLVAMGLYGMRRPVLSSGRNRDVGPFNTYAFNTLGFNVRRRVGPTNVTVTTDDVFKRIMTWNFYKGDGNTFNIRWLKRRVMRFLIGDNGSAPNIEQTYSISVSYTGTAIVIKISVGTRLITGGALYNRFGFNRMPYNALLTRFVSPPNPFAYESVLKEAIESGVLQLPFQYSVSVVV